MLKEPSTILKEGLTMLKDTSTKHKEPSTMLQEGLIMLKGAKK